MMGTQGRVMGTQLLSDRIQTQVCLASPRPSGMGGLSWAPCVRSVSQAEAPLSPPTSSACSLVVWGQAPSRGAEEAARPSPGHTATGSAVSSRAPTSAEGSRLHPPSLPG